MKPGYKQTDVGVIPEEWEADKLASVTPRNARNGIVDGPFGSNLKTIHYRKAGIPIVTSGYVTEGRFFADSYLYVEKQKFEEEKRSAVRPGDIVMAKIGARCGASAILPPGHPIGILSGNALKITVDETRHATFYIWQVLWSLYSEGNVEALRTVGAQPAISMAGLKKHKIPLPPLPEQRAIAEALSDVDALLGALDRLIAKRRDLKQAAMQQLLTGQTRLPGFHGEWEVKRLGTLLRFQVGFPFSSTFFSEKGDGIRLVRNRDLKGENQVFHYNGKYDDAFVVRDGDVLVGMDGDFLPCRWNKGCALLNQRVGRIVPNSGLDRAFSYYHLIRPLKEIEIVTSSTTVKHLSHGDIEGIECPMPPLPEQTVIAGVLGEIDAELAGLEQRREKTRALKQAMMQELLTGRTRLL